MFTKKMKKERERERENSQVTNPGRKQRTLLQLLHTFRR
jgi:hypothetical protein